MKLATNKKTFMWNVVDLMVFLGQASFLVILLVSWLTHIIHSFQVGSILFMIVGAIIPFIGMISGVFIWFT